MTRSSKGAKCFTAAADKTEGRLTHPHTLASAEVQRAHLCGWEVRAPEDASWNRSDE